MSTQFQSIGTYTLSTNDGTQLDLARIILAAQGRGATPTNEVHVWIRSFDGDRHPWKGTSSGAVEYLAALLSENAPAPFILNEDGRVYLVVNGQKFNLVTDGKAGFVAALEAVGLPKGKAHYVFGRMNGNGTNGNHSRPKVETRTEASTRQTEAEVDKIPVRETEEAETVAEA